MQSLPWGIDDTMIHMQSYHISLQQYAYAVFLASGGKLRSALYTETVVYADEYFVTSIYLFFVPV